MSVSRRRFLQSTITVSATFATLAPSGIVAANTTGDPEAVVLLSDRARRVMAIAALESQQLSHTYVGSEHVLLAIAKESEESKAYWLDELCLSHEDLQCTVQCLIPGETQPRLLPGVPQSQNLKAILVEAERICTESNTTARNANVIEPEHLLLGILDTIGTKATDVLEEMWLERGAVREAAHRSLTRLA